MNNLVLDVVSLGGSECFVKGGCYLPENDLKVGVGIDSGRPPRGVAELA